MKTNQLHAFKNRSSTWMQAPRHWTILFSASVKCIWQKKLFETMQNRNPRTPKTYETWQNEINECLQKKQSMSLFLFLRASWVLAAVSRLAVFRRARAKPRFEAHEEQSWGCGILNAAIGRKNQLPDCRKRVFSHIYCFSIALKLPGGARRHPGVSWSVSIVLISWWYKTEKFDCRSKFQTCVMVT